MRARLTKRFAPVEVSSADAPVHEVVHLGMEADLTSLPVHLQHALDGAPYISASIDYAIDKATAGRTSAAGASCCGRRRRPASTSTHRAICARCTQPLPRAAKMLEVAYTVGSHPLDFMAAMAAAEPCDELDVLGAMRGGPVPS